MKTLNVGCGSDLWGDVRSDVQYHYLTFKSKPTILADAHKLPFQEKSFEIVKCSHVLEHLEKPFEALKEIDRVSKSEVILQFPIETNILPSIVSSVFPFPNVSILLHAILTRKGKRHLWIINPKMIVKWLELKGWNCQISKNTVAVFCRLESGRKAKYFRWLTKRLRIEYEYMVIARRNNTHL